MVCGKCGEPLREGAVFCQKCGMEVTSPTGTIAPVPSVPSGPPVTPKTSGLAIASLLCGLFFFLFLPAILAIIFGHIALSQIKRSAGKLTGKGIAIAGLVLGYLEIAFMPFILIIAAIAIPNLLRARVAANEASAVGSVREINTAEVSYQSEFNKGYAPDLASLGGGPGCNSSPSSACLIDNNLANATGATGKNGYVFSVESSSDGTQYLVRAWPAAPNTSGIRTFCATEDAVIRVNSSGGAIPSREACLALPDLSGGTP